MSATTVANDLEVSPSRSTLQLRVNQLWATYQIEFSRRLFSKASLVLLGLTLIPALLVGFVSLDMYYGMIEGAAPELHNTRQMRSVFSYIYTVFILTAVIYLGNATLFTAVFRGEVLQRSLHYYLLTPVRRELLVLAKYTAALTTAIVVLGASTVICYLMIYLPYGTEEIAKDIESGIFIRELANYLGITVLASTAYGSLFMTTGLLFRSPLIPIVVVSGWEAMHFIAPPFLKMFSIIHYLKGLLPIPIDEGPMAIIVAPPPTWVSIVGLLGLSALCIFVAIFFLKRFEISYTEE